MNQSTSFHQKDIAQLSFIISTTCLCLHLYYTDYGAFEQLGLTHLFADRLLGAIVKTGLLGSVRIHVIIMVFLTLGIVASPVRKSPTMTARKSLMFVLAGLFLFCAGPIVYAGEDEPIATILCYFGPTIAGYLLMLTGGSRLRRTLRLPWNGDDPFGRSRMGFPQERRRIDYGLSLHLRAEHRYNGKTMQSWVNLLNPRRGIMILGGPGAGKSRFIIEPLLRQMIEKKTAIFLYDFKYPALTGLVYRLFQANRENYPPRTQFYCIQFSDLSRCHRCNLLAPDTLEWVSDALGAARTILLSMNKTWINRQGEFFVESPINFLGAVIWFLRKYQGGKFCTLPHAIELAQTPYEKLFPMLIAEPEIESLIRPFQEAYDNKSMEMLDSQISSALIPLSRLSSPDVYFVLTGNDLNLAINDPAAPKILCLGGDPKRQEALAPVLSLYIDRVNRHCNQPGRYPCALVVDEFATVRAYSMAGTLATARSNDIIPILAVQDLSQLRTQYTRDEADTFLNISGNLFCGQVGGETARWISDRFPQVQRQRSSLTTNSFDTAENINLHWEPTVTPATIGGLSSGEFVGILSDEPGRELELKAFHARLIREAADKDGVRMELPVVRSVDEKTVKRQFEQVRLEVQKLVIEVLGASVTSR
jgi:hypothetical protein